MLFLALFAACAPTSSISLIGTDGGTDSGDPTLVPGDSGFEHIPGDTSEEPEDTAVEPDDDAVYEAFFDASVIQTVDITLSSQAIRSLNRDGKDEYVEGDVVINGVSLPQVGVRLKGSSTYMDLDCDDGYCKAGFKIKTDEFVPDQKYGSLQRITLNNMYSDYTQSKEVIIYELLRQNSQLASRVSYARVTLNGEPWGLYANVEAMDDEWLERRFADAEGNLWATGAGGTDFSDTGMPYWESNNGSGEKDHLRALKEALDDFSGDFFGELDPYVNTTQFLEYWAWCAAVGNYDGYPFHLNDVIIYEDPSDSRRLVFMPWGTDESFDEYEYSGQTWNTVYGRLAVACTYDAACITELKDRIEAATQLYDAADVLTAAEAVWALSESDVTTDPKRPYTPDYVWYYRDYYAGVIPGYGAYVREKIGR